VEVLDAENQVVAPLDPADSKVYSLVAGAVYRYTASADDYTAKNDSVFVSGAKTVTVALRQSNPLPEYKPGYALARPSFGIYVLNRDLKSGTQLGNWDYDKVADNYLDANGETLVNDYSDSPLVYSGIDAYPATRLGVVLSGITADDVIAYYNDNSQTAAIQYPTLDSESYTGFRINCATNSGANEDPFTSNEPTNPGVLDLERCPGHLLQHDTLLLPQLLDR